MSQYDRGFASGGGRDQGARRDPERSPRARSERAVTPSVVQGLQSSAPGVAGGAGGAVKGGCASVGAEAGEGSRAWASYAGRFGLICGGIWGSAGLVSLVTTGNWWSVPVLAVLAAVCGAIPFWIVASIADVLRRGR